jgi:high frequency lysogenization protein
MDRMSESLNDRVLALAGMLQAIRLVQQMADNGQAETRPLAVCIESLFRFDAESTAAIFGSTADLQPGLRRLVAQLDGSGRDPMQTRIAMSLLNLERHFMKLPGIAAAVRSELEALAPQCLANGPTHPALLIRLGDLYAAQISPLGPKVLIQGNPVYLSQPALVGEVRACLLAALRSVVLWRQLGGSYWDFLWSRRAMVQTAQGLL